MIPTTSKLKVISFGEVLFDVFSNYKKIGGAPLNLASRFAAFGVDISIISSVGNDANGDEILKFINENGIKSFVQIDENYKTGEVLVELNEIGNATYTIIAPVAWDKITLTDSIINEVRNADVFVFGSLSCRNEVSLKTLLALLEQSKFKVFDVNFRKPFYSKSLIIHLMELSDFIKCNDEELVEILEFYSEEFESFEKGILFLSSKTNVKTTCVTRGANGAILYYENQFYENQGYKVQVVDTVGSGDSFLATLLYELVVTKLPQKALDRACAVGAISAQKEGANPIIRESEINLLLN
jgi:fructokinase